MKEYIVFSKVSRNMASDTTKKYMMKKYGRVIHSDLTDLNPEEEAFLNEYNEIYFERMNSKLKTQLVHMKNKIGIFSDPVFPKSFPWIIPTFTYDYQKADHYTKPNVFTITQEFLRGRPLDDRDYDDETKFWQYKHYEKFHVNDPTVNWGPKDINMSNLMVTDDRPGFKTDNTHKKICYVDNEGFTNFEFTERDHFRYRAMCAVNPNIGEYLPNRDCNIPYEIMRDDWSTHDEVKVFFKRLFFYERVIFNFTFIDLLDEEALRKIESFAEITKNFKHRMLVFQNWFHHEGQRVMEMTDEYVQPKRFVINLDREKYSVLFGDISIK